MHEYFSELVAHERLDRLRRFAAQQALLRASRAPPPGVARDRGAGPDQGRSLGPARDAGAGDGRGATDRLRRPIHGAEPGA